MFRRNQTFVMLARSSPDMIDMGDFDEELVQSLIGLYYFEITASCLVYLLGFIGNLFALIIFASLADFRKISTGVLFLLMTISNFFHLWTLATESIAAYGYHLYPHVFFQCRLNPFVKNVSRAMSTYFSVGITIDRLIRSEFPMRSRLICTRRNVCKLAILFLILFCFFWSFYLFSLSTQDPITRNCNYNQSESYFLFLSKINIPLRAVFFCLIPIILMVLANARMLYNIRQSHQRIADAQTINTASRIVTGVTGTNILQLNNNRSSAVDRMLFYLMVANFGVFIITQVPFHFYAVIRVHIASLHGYIHLMIYGMLLLWSSIYFGIAFYFYCLASPLFRKKFLEIFKKILHMTKIQTQNG